MADEEIEVIPHTFRALSASSLWVRSPDKQSYGIFRCVEGSVTCLQGDASLRGAACEHLQALSDAEEDGITWGDAPTPAAPAALGPADRTCEFCDAAPGAPCVTGSGREKEDFHADR